VVVRAAPGADVALQGLRAALALGLGARRPTVYLVGEAVSLVDVEEGEIADCLETLRAQAVEVVVAVSPGRALLRQLASARFQQTF
jgi:hypothetical protein